MHGVDSAPELTVPMPMPVLVCTGASIENDVVCIRLYWCLNWSVLRLVLVCIGLHWDLMGECISVRICTY